MANTYSGLVANSAYNNLFTRHIDQVEARFLI